MANPTGGNVVGGAAGITSSGNTLTVTQTSDRTVINWQSFSIAQGELTQFLQPSASSVALNRVVGANMSEIYGTLSANGKVYLINPNGVLIGAGGVVNTAGFVASTLDVKNSEFMAGGDIQFSGNSTAAVQNLGHIGVDNGDVFLIARQVENHGTINAPNGEVGLAGGTEILLKGTGSDKLTILPASGSGSVNNSTTGQIRAAMVSLKAAGGNEYALAVNNGGLIRATGTSKINGKVMLIANSGETKNTGTIAARNVDGTGGYVETSAPKLTITGTVDAGMGGFWLIDPSSIVIGDGTSGTLNAATIVASLNAGTDVLEQTSWNLTSGAGSIYVNAALDWTGTGTLTLDSYNNIEINQAITGTNGGLILLARGVYSGGSVSATGAVVVKNFSLQIGTWSQVSSTLPVFSASNFILNDRAAFLRALGGDGSSANPYQITDVYGLQGVGSPSVPPYPYNRTVQSFILANDIDATGTSGWNGGAGFTPMGSSVSPFGGTLDGNGHVVDGLTIYRPGESTIGLFNYTSVGSVIRNLTLTNVSITGLSYVGGLVGGNWSTISNCYVTGTVTGGGSGIGTGMVGGLVGWNNATLINCSMSGTVVGLTDSGGLVGANRSGAIIDSCYATGTVSGNDGVGGLVGYNTGTITNSHASSSVMGNTEIGGLVGVNYQGAISYCYATGSVNATGNYAGGLVGYNQAATIQNSFATGSVYGQDNVGGLVGEINAGSTISSCYTTGTTSGRWYIGGVVGEMAANTLVQDVYATGETTGTSDVGGLVGYNNKGTVLNGYAIGKVMGLGAGAIAGTNWGTLSSCYFATDATGRSSGTGYAGGGSVNDSTGRLLSQMKNQSAYSASWNFNLPTGNNSSLVISGIWGVDDTGVINGGLPFFQWQHPILAVTALDQTVPYGTRASTTATLGTTYTISGLMGADTVSSVLSSPSLSITGTNVNVGTTNSIVINTTQTGTVYVLKKVNGTEAFSPIDLIIDLPLATIITGSLSSMSVSYDTNYKNIYVNADVAWGSSNTLTLDALNNIQISNAITANDGGLVLKAGNAITDTAAVFVKNFTLKGGAWSQVSAALPSFSAQNFMMTSTASFLRVLGGDGSSATPYQIADIYGLQGIGGGILSKSFILANDVDASVTSGWNSGAGFQPLGSSSTNSFSGTFDGNGYTISNLTINRPTTDYVGLFGSVGSTGTVKNVTLSNVSVIGSQYVGGLAGNNGGAIFNSFVSGTVSSTAVGTRYLGGLVGSNSGTISRSAANVAVTGTYTQGVGGLVGGNTGTINQSYATGPVKGQEKVGGLVGESYGAITECFAIGTVFSSNWGGGLAGYQSGGSIATSYATGKVTAPTAGGFVGSDNSASYSNNYFATDGTGQTKANGSGATLTGVTALTMAQMKDQSYYSAAWNYTLPTGNNSTRLATGTWVIDDSGTINNGLPIFQWQYPVLVAQALDQTVLGGTAADTNPVMGTTYTVAGLIGTDTVSGVLSNISLSVVGTNVDPGTTNSIVIGATQSGTTYILKKVNGTESFVRIDLTIDSAMAALIMGTLSSTNVTFNSSGYNNIYVQSDINWGTGYTLTLDAYTNLQISNAISGNNGSLVIKAGGLITADAAILVKNFTLAGGAWSQVAAALPGFSAQNFAIANGATFFRAQGGDGSAATPYRITDVYGLQGIALSPTVFLTKNYLQINDIDASMTTGWNSGAGFLPIGSNLTNSFSGAFDGNGYTISNLTINRSTTDYVGLFGFVGSAGTVKNVTLSNVSVIGGQYVGALAGNNDGIVTSCIVSGAADAAKSGGYGLGGLVGVNSGTISRSAANVTVTGTYTQGVGGLVGVNSGTINQSYATGSVKGKETVGGLVGENYNALISDCFATGSVDSSSIGGGMVGYMYGGSLANSYTTGKVTAPLAGGFVGYDDGGSYSDNYFATDGTGQTQAEGNGATLTGITARTLAELQDQSSYSAAWNYILPTGNNSTRSATGTWVIDDSKTLNGGLPIFQWQYPVLVVQALDQEVTGGTPANTTPILGTTYTTAGLIGTDTVSGVLSGVSLSVVGTNVDPGTTNSIVIGATQSGTTYLLKKVNGTQSFVRVDLTIDFAMAALIMGSLSSTNVTFNSAGYNNIYVQSDISWGTGYTLTLDAYTNLQISNAISANNGSLVVNAGSLITADAAILVKNFTLAGGTWSQVATALPGFSAQNFAIANGATFFRAQGGDGSAATPYRIADVYGLQGIALSPSSYLSKNYLQVNDIDASMTSGWNSGAGFTPIGTDSSNSFSGTFDGGGYTIDGLTINLPSSNYVGLFGYVSSSGIIQKVNLTNAIVTGNAYVGGLVGSNEGSVLSSSAMVTLTGLDSSWNWGYVGGLIGANSGAVLDSSSSGTVTGSDVMGLGGLVGSNLAGGNIQRSYSQATVSGMEAVGGLVGYNGSNITESYAAGNVVATYGAGGLVGYNSGTISKSYSISTVSGMIAGGLIEYNDGGTVSICYASGAVQVASGGAGAGLVGDDSRGIYADTYFATDGTGQTQAAGASTTLTGVTARTLAEMQDQSNYSAAWNFALPTGNNGTLVTSGTWVIDDSKTVNNGLPVFQREHPIILLTVADQSVVYGTTINTSAILGTSYVVAGLKGADTVSSILSGLGLSVSGANVNVGTTNSIVISGTQVGTTYVIKKVAGRESFTPAALTITATDQSKTYGQTLLLGTTAFTTSGLVTAYGDSVSGVTLTSAGAASTADHGVYTISASSAVGSGLSNYDISYAYAPTGLTVNKAALTVTATDQSKTYGQTLLLGTTAFTTSGLVTANGDSVTGVTLASAGAASTADHGVYTITASSAVGNRLDNYDISYAYAPTGLTVNKTALTVTATDQSKTYGQTLLPGTTAFTTSGLVTANGDSVTGVTLTSAGAASTADHGVYTISVSSAVGNRLDNYDISYAYAPTGLTVNKAALTVTATDQSKTYGQTLLLGTTAFTTSGLVTANGDSVTGVTLTSAGGVNTANVGVYTISASSAVGNRLDNYNISYADAPVGLTVNPASITVTALGGTSIYGSSPTNPGLSAIGLQNGENVSVLTGLVNSFGIVSTTGVGIYSTSVSGTLTNANYTITGTTNGSWSITPASITVTANSGSSAYKTSPANPGLSATGLQNGETVSVLTGLTNSFGIASTTAIGDYTLSVSGTLTNPNYIVSGTTDGKWSVYFDASTSGTQQDNALFLTDLMNNSGTKGKSSGSVPRPTTKQQSGMMTGGAPTEGSLYILSTAMLEQAQGNSGAR